MSKMLNDLRWKCRISTDKMVSLHIRVPQLVKADLEFIALWEDVKVSDIARIAIRLYNAKKMIRYYGNKKEIDEAIARRKGGHDESDDSAVA